MIWPFRKRRSHTAKDTATAPSAPQQQPLTEKSHNSRVTPPSPATAPLLRHGEQQHLQSRPSTTGSQRKRRAPDTEEDEEEKTVDISQRVESKKRQQALTAEKENVRMPSQQPPSSVPHRQVSIENITALPSNQRLENSPHLRPVDVERPAAPYSFLQHSYSHNNVSQQHQQGTASRSATLRSKRSSYGDAPTRRKSSKKRKDDHAREEEVRAMNMSTPIPIPTRAGEGPLRSNSRKRQSLTNKESTVSLPQQGGGGSLNSIMSFVLEQRGWEVGSLDMFSPRPSVRLSSQPQYGSPMSVNSPSALSRQGSNRERDKRPATKTERKRQTVGDAADEFDASDLRFLLERDAKRKEKKIIEQQEKLERKLRQRATRERGDSDKNRKRRQAEETRRAEQASQRAEDEAERRTRALPSPPPPSDIHPALRDRPTIRNSDPDPLGLGINSQPQSPRDEEAPPMSASSERRAPENPFADPEPAASSALDIPAVAATPAEREARHDSMPAYTTPLETPMEDPVVEMAQAIRYSHANTPPLSPVNTRTTTSHLSERQMRPHSLPEPPPPIHDWDRRPSDPREGNKRAGAWATFFRRGGTLLRKPDDSGKTSPSEFSFSNTSRESMRNQPIPAHLIGEPSPRPMYTRSRSGTPVRTQSKFREDLPDMPLSPPDSRVHTPDVPPLPAAAASAAAARRSKKFDSSHSHQSGAENDSEATQPATPRDTPVSPTAAGSAAGPPQGPPAGRGHVLASASLASIDSEGSWLAGDNSGNRAKRASNTSGLSRSVVGSLKSKRRSDWNASYEELGGERDRDAEYLQQKRISAMRESGNPAVAGASPDNEDDDGTEILPSTEDGAGRPETPGYDAPLTVHESVRRKPTLVKRDQRLKSTEVLLGHATAPSYPGDDDDDDDLDIDTSPEDSPSKAFGGASAVNNDSDSPIAAESGSGAKLEKATSVNYGKGHARQMSAGSAKLLDITSSNSMSKRPSADSGQQEKGAGLF